MIVLKYIKLAMPAIILLLCKCGSYFYWYFAGITYYQNQPNTCLLWGFIINAVYAIIFYTSFLFYLGCLFINLHQRKYKKLIKNLILIVLFLTVFSAMQIFVKPFYVPFARGLKSCYKEYNFLGDFQQWLESIKTEKEMCILSYDDSRVPISLQQEIKRLSPTKIDVGVLPSGSKYLILSTYTKAMSFGFVVGVDENELPSGGSPPEYRIEINNESFVWVLPPQ